VVGNAPPTVADRGQTCQCYSQRRGYYYGIIIIIHEQINAAFSQITSNNIKNMEQNYANSQRIR